MRDVVQGDFLKLAPNLPAGCARLVFADPPFNIGYSYDVYRDDKPRAAYLKWAESWLACASRLVSADGSFWIAIGDEYAAEYKIRAESCGFTLQSWVIWHYTFGVHTEGKFSRCHAHLLYFVRDPKNRVWHPERIRVTSSRMEIGDARAAEHGKTPPDVWTISRVCGTFGERIKRAEGETAHPCQMAESILSRIIKSCTEPGDLVIDPFGGSGTTVAVANKLGRKFWTCELSPAYCEVIRARLNAAQVFDDEGGTDYDELAEQLGIN